MEENSWFDIVLHSRIIYCNNSDYETWLLAMYDKNERENIPAHELKKIREAINDRENE